MGTSRTSLGKKALAITHIVVLVHCSPLLLGFFLLWRQRAFRVQRSANALRSSVWVVGELKLISLKIYLVALGLVISFISFNLHKLTMQELLFQDIQRSYIVFNCFTFL